ncbi:uncharacterized protein K460DRAFT_310690, partial [Cucurbitaria berberidis CBS 394.84]
MQTFLRLSTAQLPAVLKPNDVVTFFCSRWYHQSIVKNDILYLYGGIQTFNVPNLTVKSTNNTLGYNPFLLQLSLKDSWNWQNNISWLSYPIENNPRTGAHVRHAMTNGAMYHGPYNSSSIWTYSGTVFRGNTSVLDADGPYANQYPLWSFDNETQNWDQFDLGQLKTPSYGLSAEAPDQGLAFYLNGQTDNGTDPDTWVGGDTTTLLSGMMVIDLVHQRATNISTTSMKDPQPRIGGAMQYIPGLADSGVIVALGGKVYDGIQTTTSQTRGRLLSFDNIDLFDIASYLTDSRSNGTWYQQATSGEVPPPRIDSCTAMASAPDNSTHNIYMYGGWDPTGDQTKWYDDVYVLSLPSFTWVKMFQADSPRYGHTCHLVGRQLLTIGGHNVRRNITNMCDWEQQSIGVLDLPTMTWGSIFDASHQQYEMSKGLVDKIGGTPQGSNAMAIPMNGWSSPALEAIIRTNRTYSHLNGTIEVIRPNTGTSVLSLSTRTAIIAGITVTVVTLITCIAWLLYIRHKRRNVARRAENSMERDGRFNIFEVEEKAKYELSPDEKKVYEMISTECRHESPDTAVTAEADRANAVTYAAELPATNFSEGGRWGVPIIKVPSPSASRRGSAVAG